MNQDHEMPEPVTQVYAGIDEAGYGPLFGPLVVSRMVMGLRDPTPMAGDDPSAMWQVLSKAVSRSIQRHKGRVVVNDSKKLRTPAAGIRWLELGTLAFSSLAGYRPESVSHWLDDLAGPWHANRSALPWYAPTDDPPHDKLPTACSEGELAVSRGLLTHTAQQAGVRVLDLGGCVVFEDQFNRRLKSTRSKAALSFTYVAGHLREIWDRYGALGPRVMVDRQSGRTRYRSLLMMNFPDAVLSILEETPQTSAYHLVATPAPGSSPGYSPAGRPTRSMTVRFEVDADSHHMPVSLASMISKYTRELMMARFQGWFTRQAPHIKPTAGYASDAKRFWQEIQPMLGQLGIHPEQLRRQA